MGTQQFKQKFLKLWQIELVRCYERDHKPPNVSTVAPNQTNSQKPLDTQLYERALVLIKYYKLDAALSKSIASLKLMLLLVFTFALIFGVGLAKAVDNSATRELSLPGVLLALLGFHLLMYFIWLASFFVRPKQSGISSNIIKQGMQFFNPNPKANYVTQSLLHTLSHYQLGKLLAACITHTYWFLLLFSSSLMLSLLFLFQSYTFTWETTVLDLPVMNHLSELLGSSLSWLGVNLPDVTALQAAEPNIQAKVGRWLIVMLVVYGCGIRLITGLISASVLATRVQNLEVDKTQPGLSNLIPLLLRGAAQTIDKDSSVNKQTEQPNQPNLGLGDYWLELEHAQNLSEQLAEQALTRHKALGVIATLTDLERLADQFNMQPAASILITIDNQLTPDRGNLRLIRGLLPLTAHLHCYLIHPQGNFTESWLAAINQLISEHATKSTIRLTLAEYDHVK